MNSRWVLALGWVLALLLAQQGAALHALAHLATDAPTQTQQDPHLPNAPACDQCLAYAGVGNATLSTAATVATLPTVTPACVPEVTAFFPRCSTAYSARAPPSLI